MPFRTAVALVIALEVLTATYAVLHYGATVEGLQAVTRFSGRVSLAVFSIMFLLLPNAKRLSQFLSDKPFHVFAVAHGIHLAELLTYVYLSETPLIPVRLAGGFLAYAFVFAMPLLQHRHEQGRIAEGRFALMKLIYLYYVWFIFFMSYLPRVQGKLPHVGGHYAEFVVLLTWVCLMLGTKLSMLVVRRHR
jgi:hypothetical protein